MIQAIMVVALIFQAVVPVPIFVPMDQTGTPRTFYGTLNEIQVIDNVTYLKLDADWYMVTNYRVNPTQFLHKDVHIVLQGSNLNDISEDSIGTWTERIWPYMLIIVLMGIIVSLYIAVRY